MVTFKPEEKVKIVKVIVYKLEDKVENTLVEKYYDNGKSNMTMHMDKAIKETIDKYFDDDEYIEDVQDYLSDEYFDENGNFDETKDIKDDVKEMFYENIKKELTKLLENFIEDFDDSNPHSLSTYGLTENDFL